MTPHSFTQLSNPYMDCTAIEYVKWRFTGDASVAVSVVILYCLLISFFLFCFVYVTSTVSLRTPFDSVNTSKSSVQEINGSAEIWKKPHGVFFMSLICVIFPCTFSLSVVYPPIITVEHISLSKLRMSLMSVVHIWFVDI